MLRGADISLCEGELMCLLGGNGAGKSTLLSVLCGLNKAYRGKVKLNKGKKLCMLPQNARTLFVADTVHGELTDAANVLLLDEPTKGLDAYAKLQLANMLKGLCKEGAAILAITHDVDFAAQYADECAMMFDGGIISRGEPHEFFGGNRFYTTDANRIAGDIAPGCITSGEVASQCKKLLQ